MDNFIVKPYNSSNLSESLSNSFTSSLVISSKKHFIYLEEYLEEIETKTILIEENYLSKAYNSDFSFYYAKCFQVYPKFCRRVHFFSKKFNQSKLETDIVSKDASLLKFYLGYIVVKPIPFAVIGPTLLKTYKITDKSRKRNFFGVRPYLVHLLGHSIIIDSLAFQEQDKTVSACATTAIWCMLHKASKTFETKILNPNQITHNAGITAAGGGRLFPNKGLNTRQMCEAIYKSGLVTEIRVVDSQFDPEAIRLIKQLVYAYSKIGIPLILNIEVPFEQDELSAHAVTICGFKIKRRATKINFKDEVTFISDRIEKIYVHDDQWGPFSRIDLNKTALRSSWSEFDEHGKRDTISKEILIPVYPNIRISYDDVLSIVYGIDGVLTLAFEDHFEDDLQWEIFLVHSNNFKDELRKSKVEKNTKLKILKSSYPKYIWQISCFVGSEKILDYIFDATSLSTSMYGLDGICYYSDLKKYINEFVEMNPDLCAKFEHDNCVDFIQFVKLSN